MRRKRNVIPANVDGCPNGRLSVQTRRYVIEDICRTLRSAGYTSLDRQAKALGLHRSTAWTIVKNKHKVGRLSKKTVNRILLNPKTPPAVRAIVWEYVTKRS